MQPATSQSVNQKVVVITGASSGAGKAIAVELATHGAQLVLAARNEEALRNTETTCNELGAKTRCVVTDTRDASSMSDLAQAAVDFAGHIDIWINNAGVLAAGALDEIPSEVNVNVIRTNLIGYMNGAHAVLPRFKKQGYGMLINNISVGGWFPTPYAAAYTASKFGLRGFFESLKGELHSFPHIHICDLYPAFLDTPGIQHAANYTGRVVKPAPPVYDPRKVARAVVSLIAQPKNKTIIGASSGFLGLAYQLFPVLSRNITAFTIRKYLQQADPIENTSGNVLHSVPFGNNIDGGWRKQLIKPKTKLGMLFVAGVAAGLILTNSRSR